MSYIHLVRSRTGLIYPSKFTNEVSSFLRWIRSSLKQDHGELTPGLNSELPACDTDVTALVG